MNGRGYFGIGVYHPKTAVNIGTLWRSALIFGADFIFTIGRRYNKQASDTLKTWRHVPLFNFQTFEEFQSSIPYDCILVYVELADHSEGLDTFKHPERAVYLLGAEDNGIPEVLINGKRVIQIPGVNDFCLNVSVAGSIVMYDRLVKQ